MSDQHCEEQEMEAEALAAIFDSSFSILSEKQPFEWSIQLLPMDYENDEDNHVGIILKATLPLDYPEVSLPQLHVEIIKGLTQDHVVELEELAQTEAANNEGMPAMYAICEVLREWLVDHNKKGLDDASMHAQMMRRAQDQERKQAVEQQEFESQTKVEIISQAEQEEQLVLKRRAEGTPCNKENFLAWKLNFQDKMEQKQFQEEQLQQQQNVKNKKEKKKEDKSGRLTGFEQFSNKTLLNMDAMEAAAEQAEQDEIDPDELNVEEDLFDDDEDLDDLDFDDDSEDEDDDDEPDI